MVHFIEYIQDTLGSNFLGVKIPTTEVQVFLDKLKGILGDSYDEFRKYQQDRDKGEFHITLMNVMEYNQLSKEFGMDKFINSLDPVLKFQLSDIKLLGIGKAEKHGNTAYYIVVQSEQLGQIRKHYDLPEKDFNISIGFKFKDVHGVRKNEILKEESSFLKELKKKYRSEGESFEFIKGIKNFKGDFFKLIEPIKINDTNAIFRIGMDYYQISLVDNSLYITGEWQDENNIPILSDTMINKKFKN